MQSSVTPSLDKLDQRPVALVTGGAKRIGAVITQTLCHAGYRVIIHYHQSHQAADDLVQSLNQQYQNPVANALSADLNHFESYDSLIKKSIAVWGRLDVLVNNASSFYPTLIGETTPLHWEDLINTNLKAPYFLSQAAAPFLKQHQGVIINIADIHGQKPLKKHAVYSIAKAGLIMLTQSLAKELAPDIRVNAIAPGVTLLPEKKLDPKFIGDLRERTLLKRFAQPQDIADAILFLINQSAITGQTIIIDGGRCLR